MQDVSHDETTLRIIESAKKVFLQNGYQGASLRVICHRAGITTGAFYHRFSGKSELYEAVVVPRLNEVSGNAKYFSHRC